MTKTESANLTAQTVLIESAEQVLQLQMAEGVRLAIPNTNNLIMVGPQEWIAKNVPGVEAMVEGALTNERIIEIADTTKTAESRDGDYILPISFARAIEREVITRLAATTQASTAQAERVPEGFVLMPVRLTPEMKQAGGHANSEWLNDNAPIGETRYAMPMESIYAALCAAAPVAPVGQEAATSSTDAQAAAEVRDAWISVDERLPEMYQTVALLDEKRWMNTVSRDHNVNWHGSGYLCEFGGKYWSIFGEMRSQCLDAVTHWMPLPAAPKRAGDTGEQADGGAA